MQAAAFLVADLAGGMAAVDVAQGAEPLLQSPLLLFLSLLFRPAGRRAPIFFKAGGHRIRFRPTAPWRVEVAVLKTNRSVGQAERLRASVREI